MKAADSSWRTWMNRSLSWFLRRDSKMPLMPSPGSPKTVSTPQASSFSTITSPVVFAITHLLDPGDARPHGPAPDGLPDPVPTARIPADTHIVAVPGRDGDRENRRTRLGTSPTPRPVGRGFSRSGRGGFGKSPNGLGFSNK